MPEERSPFGSGLTDTLKCQRLAELDDPIAVKVWNLWKAKKVLTRLQE